MINKIPYLFIQDFKHLDKVIMFKKTLYLFLFFNSITMLPMIDDIFSYNGIAGPMNFEWNGIESFLNLLNHPYNNHRPYIAVVFVIGQMVALIMGIFKIWPILSNIAIYFFTTNLITKGSLFFTGGEVLVCILLFYMIFIQENKSKNQFRNILNNTFYYISIIQILVLYFFSTYFKLFDPNWTNGMAMVYVSEISFYSSDWFYYLTHHFKTLAKISTFLVLIYQGIFPLLVWIKPIKIPFLTFGILMHLGISFGMGIFSFGIIMIITYILFLEQKHISQIQNYFNFTKLK